MGVGTMNLETYCDLIQSINNNNIFLERKGFHIAFSQSPDILSGMVFNQERTLIAQLKVTDKNNEIAIRSYANRLNQLVKSIKEAQHEKAI